MFADGHNRIMHGRLIPGVSIGPSDCHYGPEGHSHSLVNDGEEDLVFFPAVPQHG